MSNNSTEHTHGSVEGLSAGVTHDHAAGDVPHDHSGYGGSHQGRNYKRADSTYLETLERIAKEPSK